jgi:hypothetical protein
VRLYSASSEETLRAGQLLADWVSEGFLTKEQYQRLEQETVSDLRTTNIFLRLVLFLFTLISVGTAVALFFKVFLLGPSEQTIGVFFLIFAGVCYAAAEITVSQAGSIGTGSKRRSPPARLVFSAQEYCSPFSPAALIRRSWSL